MLFGCCWVIVPIILVYNNFKVPEHKSCYHRKTNERVVGRSGIGLGSADLRSQDSRQMGEGSLH